MSDTNAIGVAMELFGLGVMLWDTEVHKALGTVLVVVGLFVVVLPW